MKITKDVKKKLLFIIDSLSSGGAQRQMVLLAKNIDRDKYEVSVLIYHDLRHYEYILKESNIPVFLIPKKYYIDPIFFFALIKRIRELKPDLILSYLNTPNMWARLAGKLTGVRTIITSERDLFISHSKIRTFIEKLLHHWSTWVVVNSSVTKKLLHDVTGMPEIKIKTIYNGVDLGDFSNPDENLISKLTSEFKLKTTDQVILLPGRISSDKNHICLVHAFVQIARQNPNSKLLFVGNEQSTIIKEQINQIISQENIRGRVIFAGRRTEMKEIYSLSEIVVLPSLWEGFPNVILEAMSAMKIVIASDISDNSKLVKHGINGWLFKSDETADLVKYLNEALSLSPSDKKSMAESGYQHVRDNFSIKKMVGHYEKLFSECSDSNH